MIDTIEMHIHDLAFHKPLVDLLYKSMLREGRSVKYQKMKVTGTEREIDLAIYNRKFLHLANDAEIQELTHFNHLKSNHYHLAYQISFARDMIIFNFSIPKYIYGTNIIQFLPHYPSKDVYRPGDGRDHFQAMERELKKSFLRLKNFITQFFTSEFGSFDIIHPSKLEIARIDFCYNQIFFTKEEALDYLKDLKKIRRKHERESSDVLQSDEYGDERERISEDQSENFTRSIFRSNQRYSFKIYHKGTEYQKHDAVQHRKLNKAWHLENGSMKNEDDGLFNIPMLQKMADRTLRYEATFRGTYMSYLFHQKVFRSRNNQWKQLFTEYGRLQNLISSKKISPERDKHGNLKQVNGKYVNTNVKELLTSQQIKRFNYVSNILNKTAHFYFDTLPSDQKFQTDYIAQEEEIYAKNYRKVPVSRRAKFSEHLFLELSSRFLGFVQEFYIRDKQPAKAVFELFEMDQLSKRRKRSDLTMSRLQAFLKIWELCEYSFDKIIQDGFYSRMQVYRYRVMLKEMKIDARNVKSLNSSYLALWDFTRYDDWINANLTRIPTLKRGTKF